MDKKTVELEIDKVRLRLAALAQDLAAIIVSSEHEDHSDPQPARRLCPACKHSGMAAATRCGFCWVALTPVPQT